MYFKKIFIYYFEKIRNRVRNIKKRSLYCIGIGIVFAVLSLVISRDSIYIRPYEIKRGAYGTEKTIYKILVDAENLDSNLKFDIAISPKRYTKEEADKIYKSKIEKVLIDILGDNPDFDNVSEKLNFSQDIGDGVRANYVFIPELNEMIASSSDIVATSSEAKSFTYYKKYQGLIDASGNIKNQDFKINEKCSGYIEIQFSTEIKDKEGTYKSEKYLIPIIVISKKLSELESFKNAFKKEIVKKDNETINEDSIKLPRIVNNFRIVYKDKFDFTFIFMPIFGVLVAILLEAKDKEKIREEERKKRRKLETDFSQIISKILLYVCSGMTIRNSMMRLATDYQEKLKKGIIEKRIAYDEIVIVKNKLLSGYGEQKAYEEMARNINLRTYTRFLNIIIQSIKNGNKDLKNILNMEVQDALYERKQRAKKLGEEASTKLVLPLMLMLSVIMVVIMVPAFMGM